MLQKLFFFLSIISISMGHHYRGGSLIAVYLNNTIFGYHKIQLTVGFVWSFSDYKCNDWIIDKHELIGPYNDYIYLKNGKRITSCEAYCEKYSEQNNWTYGRKSLEYSTNENYIEIYYENCCWERVKGDGLNWQFKFKMNLTEPNHTPIVNLQPLGMF
jgi:hypothetical protein